MSRKPGRHALIFLFITVVVDMIGIGIIIPVMPSLIMEVTGGGVAEAARWGGALLVAFALMQFLFAPLIGNLSDRFGRRPVLIGSLIGYSGDFLLMAFAPTLAWLFVGRALSGFFAATFSTANAYIADISPPEKRAQNFGMIGAAFGLGFIIGPVIGGLLGEIDTRAPFFAASALAALNALYGFLVLPETLSPENRRPFSLARANPLGAFKAFRANPIVVGIAGVFFLYHTGHWALTATWSYYTQARFEWGAMEVGLSLAYVGLTSAIVMGGLTRLIVPKLGNRRAAALGLTVFSIQFLGLGAASQGWMIFVVVTFGALAAIAMPAMQGIAANAVGNDQQGELNGALTSVQSLTAIIGPLLMTQLFFSFNAPDAAVKIPGAAFYVASVLTLGALALLLFVTRGLAKQGAAPEATNT